MKQKNRVKTGCYQGLMGVRIRAETGTTTSPLYSRKYRVEDDPPAAAPVPTAIIPAHLHGAVAHLRQSFLGFNFEFSLVCAD